jgi:uncharacterized protein (TIGR01777 family)
MSEQPQTVLITGATGLVGKRLVRALLADRCTVRAATRTPANARLPGGVEAVGWDGVMIPSARVAGCDALVHLAGEPVFGGLLTKTRRERIYTSRIDSTRALVESIGRLPAAERPKVLVCASAVGYYGDRGDERLHESAAPGSGFLADLCVAWEEEARAAAALGVRTVSLRIGIVLAREGGALASLARLFRLGLGGRVGSGAQWVPWIHVDDLVAMIVAALRDERWSGAVNAVAPNPVTNAELTRELARAVRRPALLPAPAFAVRAALGDIAGEILGSRRVIPARAAELGFRFRIESLERALEAELR